MGSRFSAAAQIVFSRRPLWSLTDQIIVSGANFVTMIILARRLGLAALGALTHYWTSVLFIAALHAAFIIMPMVVLHAQHEADARRTYHGTVAGLHLSFVGAALAVSLPLLALLAAVGLVALEVMLPLVACFAFGLMHEYLRRLIFLEDKFLDLAGSDLARYVLQILGLMLLGGPGGLTIMAAFWVLAGSRLV